MEFKIKDLIKETGEPFRKDYWKITAVSILLLFLSLGLSYSTVLHSVNEIPDLIKETFNNEFAVRRIWDLRMTAILLTLVGGLLLLSMILKLLADILLDNPVRVGADRMMLDAMEQEKPVMLARLAYAFDEDYIKTVKVMFLKTLFNALWSLLLIVPGIIKFYEYRLIPYLLAENPCLTHQEAFRISKAMMKGNKWKAFLLDLYFVPWEIFGVLTAGILTVLYVEPKRHLACAAFYLKIKEMNEKGGEA